MLSAQETDKQLPAPGAQRETLSHSIFKHALVFGMFGPLFGCLFALLAALAVTLSYGGAAALSQSVEVIGRQPLQWLVGWIGGSYAYGVIPAFLAGACTAWLARKPFKKPRFIALVVITGWVFTFLRFFTVSSLVEVGPLDAQILAAFLTGAIGALAALSCLWLTRFLRAPISGK